MYLHAFSLSVLDSSVFCFISYSFYLPYFHFTLCCYTYINIKFKFFGLIWFEFWARGIVKFPKYYIVGGDTYNMQHYWGKHILALSTPWHHLEVWLHSVATETNGMKHINAFSTLSLSLSLSCNLKWNKNRNKKENWTTN